MMGRRKRRGGEATRPAKESFGKEPPARAEGGPPTKGPVILALLDVLGFSARLERDGLDATLRLYQDLINRAVLTDAYRCLGARDAGDGTRVPVLFALPVKYAYFSDTILLWVPLDPMFADPFVLRCANLVCEALNMGVPLRGALVLGEAVLDQSTGTYLGKPLVEAARLEAAQGWVGLTFAPSATWPPFLAELSPKLIIEYAAPMKQGTEDRASPVVLDWPRRSRELTTRPALELLKDMATAAPHAYYDATADFVRFSEANHEWFERPPEERPNAKLRMGPPEKALGERR